MATIRKNIEVNASAERVLDVVRDIGAIHTRFVPGLVVDTKLEPGARVVTFANSVVVRELIVDVNDDLRRLAYSAVGGVAQHHNASFEVVAIDANRTRLVWTTDVLPDAAAAAITPLIEKGSQIIRETLER